MPLVQLPDAVPPVKVKQGSVGFKNVTLALVKVSPSTVKGLMFIVSAVVIREGTVKENVLPPKFVKV
jgi:hypothetical protein